MAKRETVSLPKDYRPRQDSHRGDWQEVDDLLIELHGDLRMILQHRAASPPALRTLEVDIGLVLEIHDKLDRLRGANGPPSTHRKGWGLIRVLRKIYEANEAGPNGQRRWI
ncbi:MAG: hypothetical protein M3Q03_16550 [Chloroflexota bacterium]|nr:hypothetical protein [Chloroflexota bacterium]